MNNTEKVWTISTWLLRQTQKNISYILQESSLNRNHRKVRLHSDRGLESTRTHGNDKVPSLSTEFSMDVSMIRFKMTWTTSAENVYGEKLHSSSSQVVVCETYPPKTIRSSMYIRHTNCQMERDWYSSSTTYEDLIAECNNPQSKCFSDSVFIYCSAVLAVWGRKCI